MQEKYLVINAGSSSLKFSLYSMPDATEIVNGYFEKIGKEDSFYSLKYNSKKEKKTKYVDNHATAINIMLEELLNNNFISDVNEIKGIGHRVLHGGEYYDSSVLINDEVLENIKEMTKLGPLHHPGEIAGIEGLKEVLPDVPQVAVFDTAFHQSMPIENYLYAVPYEWYTENGVRKYGFHGTSHNYITNTMKEKLNNEDVNLIICHVGSGASITCVKNGKCYDTSMGLTPLDGLVMGTRSGSIDPSIIEYISKERNLSIEEINTILNKQSGLLGISTKNDLRDVEQLASTGNERAKIAIKMLKDSIIKYIAQYYFELNGKVDALVFTAGVGENAIELREDIINSISNVMGVSIDSEKNSQIAGFKDIHSGIISTDDSKTKVYVIPTDEEYMILKDTYDISKNMEKDNIKRVLK